MCTLTGRGRGKERGKIENLRNLVVVASDEKAYLAP